MTNDDDLGKALAYCRPVSSAISTTVEQQLLAAFGAGRTMGFEEGRRAGYEEGRTAGYEAGAAVHFAALEAWLASRGETRPEAPGDTPAPGSAGPPPTRPPPMPPPSAKEEGGPSARAFAYEIVRTAHPKPVPSLTILKALRARDNKDKSARRDDLFYKAMRRLREDGHIVQTDQGYVLPKEHALDGEPGK